MLFFEDVQRKNSRGIFCRHYQTKSKVIEMSPKHGMIKMAH